MSRGDSASQGTEFDANHVIIATMQRNVEGASQGRAGRCLSLAMRHHTMAYHAMRWLKRSRLSLVMLVYLIVRVSLRCNDV